MSFKRRAFVLRGEGIECEMELFRCLGLFVGTVLESVSFVAVSDLRKSSKFFFESLLPGDFFFLPGGFSFSDHFGSGRLLAAVLREQNLIEEMEKRRFHLLGICNGFQTLAHLGAFGKGVCLLSNNPPGFQNRWVNLKWEQEVFRFPVRHGEGRLVVDPGGESKTQIFLTYDDPSFSNGSQSQAAGLLTQFKSGSCVWGLMPHPEIALRVRDDPAFRGPGFNEASKNQDWVFEGSGVKFFQKMFSHTHSLERRNS